MEKNNKFFATVPNNMQLFISNASTQNKPTDLIPTTKTNMPIVVGTLNLINNENIFFALKKVDSLFQNKEIDCATELAFAEIARKKIADRITVNTPDSFLNTLGGVLSIAADAVWDSPTFMHGSIGWRMRLNGWRGPYVGDVLGWHDRAKTHFRAYAKSQLTTPLTGPIVMDTALHLARSFEKIGTSIFSEGYICRNPNGDIRPHHYDMNLVYIDALIRHLRWTGDIDFAKEMWPVITRHLAWEKRNFDPDNDGLYDAYAAIWASDALQYSGGAVTHSSAYNYYANKEAENIALLIGEDGFKYKVEAEKISKAINKTLWMPNAGSYAEFKDLLGNKLLHPNAAVWSIYHSLDSELPNALQAYQAMQYIDNYIPHIPVNAKGLSNGYATISTSNWMPYDWSLNNVATAEVMHTALAQWQASKTNEAFNLFKSELLSTMYMGGSAGNIGQISFYDAARGEAYRDFADPVAMTARSLVEGLFGIMPNALNNELIIKPGFPLQWNNATLTTPDINFDFKRNKNVDVYLIKTALPKALPLQLIVKANGADVVSVLVNGIKALWKNNNSTIGYPTISVEAGIQKKYLIKIIWKGKLQIDDYEKIIVNEEKVVFKFNKVKLLNFYDPQMVLHNTNIKNNVLYATANTTISKHCFFVHLQHNAFKWWQAINVDVKRAVEINAPFVQEKNTLQFSITNNTNKTITGQIYVNGNVIDNAIPLILMPHKTYNQNYKIAANLVVGSNQVSFKWDGNVIKENIINWNINNEIKNIEAINIGSYFNDKVTNIFKNQYLSPRPTVATLQLPTQGIGDWTHPLKTANIDDRGLRKLAGNNKQFTLPQGILFATPSDTLVNNILFTSQWDNYPNEAIVSLNGSASHIYLLMAGSTNPMQSRLVNGAVIINYTDNTADTLLLKNPENWWPIEQDYMDDGFAFTTDAAKPIRIHLKTGKIVSELDNSMKTYAGKIIYGGAATVLDLPLNKNKKLKELKLQTIANDVVIGLMGITLIR